jgi:hypothetical protein
MTFWPLAPQIGKSVRYKIAVRFKNDDSKSEVLASA